MTEIDNALSYAPLSFAEPPEDGKTYGESRKLLKEAAHELGVNLSDQELYDWLAVMEASLLIDHLADVEKVGAVAPFRQVLAGSFRSDLSQAVQVRTYNYFARQVPEQRQAMLARVSEVNDLTKAQRISTKPREVIDIRVNEAEIFASLLALEVTDTPDADGRQKFNDWIRHWSRAGYLIDSFFDVREDF